jgi:hypothetical protein
LGLRDCEIRCRGGRLMVLAYALLAAICAGTAAWVFVLSWRDRDVPLAALLGVAIFALLVVAIVALRAAL